ncbi:MAG TPA: hypothetical protein VG943_10370 [Caulobacterales bacterium]|nr:hypothetical protein [Caulobacterales bacterium]
MHELLERLGRGDARIMEMCGRANRAWSEFFSELETADVGTLSARLGFFQPAIEKIFESKSLGETMMAWTAFANLYDTKAGWGAKEKRARDLVWAFLNSNCSAEVKEEARSAAISYGLERTPGSAPQRQDFRR